MKMENKKIDGKWLVNGTYMEMNHWKIILWRVSYRDAMEKECEAFDKKKKKKYHEQ
jgi:hypothetical protein